MLTMLNSYKLKLAVATVMAVAIALSIGCAVKSTTTGTPVATTPLQRVIQANATLAKANLAAEQAVEKLQSNGLLTVAQARPIIIVTGQIATVSGSILVITQSTNNWTSDATEIKTILDTTGVQKSLSGIGVSDATTTAILGDIAAALTLIQTEVQ